mgnify:CR=1 FL=1
MRVRNKSMTDTRTLRRIMKTQDVSIIDLAQHLNISTRTLTSRMADGNFNLEQVDKIITFLNIENPTAIFLN